MLYQKLQNLLDDFKTTDKVQELWKDISTQERADHLGKINIELDTQTGEIEVTSKELNSDGKPVYDWRLEQTVGQFTQVRRESGEVETLPPTSEPATELVVAPIVDNAVVEALVEEKTQVFPPEWDDKEM